MGFNYLIGVFGVLILAHAAYSTIRYRRLLKLMEEEFSGPSMNVSTEVLLGLLLCVWAALIVPGKFLFIHPHCKKNRSLLFLWVVFSLLNDIGNLGQHSDCAPYGSHTFLVLQKTLIKTLVIVSLPANLDFMIFNHRGKVFPLDMNLNLKL